VALIEQCKGFDWDEGNSLKNWLKHGVTQAETEQVFSNEPFFIYEDEKHSESEPRRLVGSFTIRGLLIRPISARK
jgi:uncharacterized DUF497 family protein